MRQSVPFVMDLCLKNLVIPELGVGFNTPVLASGILDSSLKFHLMNAKNHGVTKEEIAEILTHAAFYAGWRKAWAAFRMAKEVWVD